MRNLLNRNGQRNKRDKSIEIVSVGVMDTVVLICDVYIMSGFAAS